MDEPSEGISQVAFSQEMNPTHMVRKRVFHAWLIAFTGCFYPLSAEADFREDRVTMVVDAKRDSVLDRMFRTKRGWIGGDSAESISLDRDRILWLFGDSYLGREEGGVRRIDGMIRNAVAIQKRKKSGSSSLRFYPDMRHESPGAFFLPDGREWVWPCRGGLRTASGLYVFLPKFRTVAGRPDGFGFASAGMIFARIPNPDESPDRWHIRYFPVPSSICTKAGRKSFGNPFRGNDGHIYFPGMDELSGGRRLLMARTSSENLEDFGSWEFRTSSGWSRRPQDAVALCDHLGAELSLCWKPALGSYLLVNTRDGLSDRIVGRIAPTPWGPWSHGVTLFRAPEARHDASISCYAGKEHPELSAGKDEIVISYVCNADPKKVVASPRLYRPQFVRVRLRAPGP